jgi:inward rectifier potassium channel
MSNTDQGKEAHVRFNSGSRPALPKLRAVGKKNAPLDDLYHFILKARWSVFFLIVTAAFVLINAIFGLVYVAMPGAIANAQPGSFGDAFFFSVQTVATIGYGNMSPQTGLAHIVVGVEALVGIFCTALITGMTFAKFAKPTARVLFCEKAVVGPRNGVPHLQFRMANWRHNEVAEAQLRVVVLMLEKTTEGESIRVPHELKLVRDRTAFFILSWTAMHAIDESSPFYGDGMEKLKAMKADIFLSLSGLDETIGQTIHARYRYSLDDIVVNARFADILDTDTEGVRTLDYRQFHKVLPITPPST